MQMHYVLFKITTSPQGDPSESMVHHKVRKTKATGSDHSANTGNWTTVLQDLVLGGPDLGENLIEAMEPSAPEQPEIGSAESLDKLVFPRLNAFRCLVQHSDGFNEAAGRGLVAHAECWTTEDRINEIDGVFHLGLLALACLAYDTAEVDPGFRLEAESGRLPKHLVQRSWYGEFPT